MIESEIKEIVRAWCDGGDVECCQAPILGWRIHDSTEPPCSGYMVQNGWTFRIKPKPKYIPHTLDTAPEFWQGHSRLDINDEVLIIVWNDHPLMVWNNPKNVIGGSWGEFDELFECLDCDGNPYGQLVTDA